jgi:tRNA threonylcarbamoyladenosine biosynthesis protein TsaB
MTDKSFVKVRVIEPAHPDVNGSGAGPLTLAVETSGRLGSVALGLGSTVVAEAEFSAPMRHSSELFDAIGALVKRFNFEARQIRQVFISIGPGSFTGLRIAVTAAKMMHLATAVRVVAVDTLDVIAANASEFISKTDALQINRIAVVLDAKRGQFFIAIYKNKDGRLLKHLGDRLMTAEDFISGFADRDDPVWLLGEGLVYYKKRFESEGINFFDEDLWYPGAEKVYKLGWALAEKGMFADAITLVPRYLREPDVTLK